ncbi:MAG: Ig-like domain-containing protein [Paludibacteraceae bacterium]|nr:Ig-like domain-containing protein [Paludibacteraceae bacterium]
MKKRLLFVVSSLLLSCMGLSAADYSYVFATDGSNAPTQGQANWTSADGVVTIPTNDKSTARSKTIDAIAYTFAPRAKSFTFNLSNTGITSLGGMKIAVQNGSSGNPSLNTLAYSTDNATWVTFDTMTLAGNAAAHLASTKLNGVTSIASLPALYIRLTTQQGTYLYGFSFTDGNATDVNPVVLSSSPAENASIDGSGTIELTCNEVVTVANASAVSFAAATGASVTEVKAAGNRLYVSYSGFAATGALIVGAGAVADLEGNTNTASFSVTFDKDATAPTLTSINPEENSTIHIQDLGEDARKIKLTFDEDIALDETNPITFGNGVTYATVTPSVSGNVLTISYNGLAYDATNTLTIPANAVADLTGNVWNATDRTFTFLTGSRDATAPVLVAQEVSDGATDVEATDAITFTFDEDIVVNAQTAMVNGEPAVLSNYGKVVGLSYTAVPYNATVSVTIPNAALTDTCGNIFGGLSFSMTTKAQPSLSVTKVVDAGGNGDYTTIQAAIDAITDESQRTVIFVKPGTYHEKLVVYKKNVSLIGQSRDEVIITFNECAQTSTLQNGTYNTSITSTGTDASYSMLVAATGFYGENFTVRNDYDYINGTEGNKQAVALEMIDPTKSANYVAALKNVRMVSFQDTYYPKSDKQRTYLKDCVIEGGTDYVFGSGTNYMEGGAMVNVDGGQYMTAASGQTYEFGLVFHNVKSYYSDTTGFGSRKQYYLGRPWKMGAFTSYVDCEFESGMIQAKGWADWSGAINDAIYTHKNLTVTGGTAMNTSAFVDWSSELSNAEAIRYAISDNAFNYGAGNAWNGAGYTAAPDSIDDVVVMGGTVTWTAPDNAVGYIIYKNGVYYATSVTNSYVDGSFSAGDTYEVAAMNEFGSTSPTSVSQNTLAVNEVAGNASGSNVKGVWTLNGQQISEDSNANVPAGIYVIDGVTTVVNK